MKYKTGLMIAMATVAIATFSPIAAATSQGPMAVAQAVVHEAYSSETALGTLLDDAKAKAILMQIIPTVIDSPQIDMARGMTLRQLQQYSPEKLTDETLKKIDTELAKLNAAKS